MLILLSLVLLILISFLVAKYTRNDFLEFIAPGIALCSFIALCVAVFILAMNHATASYTISQYNAVKDTIEYARENETSDLERAALTTRIIETNQNIASYKWMNDNYFDIFIPDEWAELEPLQ